MLKIAYITTTLFVLESVGLVGDETNNYLTIYTRKLVVSDKENNSKFMSIVLASIIRSVKKDISDKGIVYKLILDSIEAGFKTKLSKEYYKNKGMEADLELEGHIQLC